MKAFLIAHIDAIVATTLALAAFLVSDNFREWNREAMRAHESLRDVAAATVQIVSALANQHAQGRAVSLPLAKAQLTQSAARFRTERNRPADEATLIREQGIAAEVRERVVNHSLAMAASLRDAADDISRRYRSTLDPLPIDMFKIDRLSSAPWIASCVSRMWPEAPEPVRKAIADYGAAVHVEDPPTYRERTFALSDNLQHLAGLWSALLHESSGLAERAQELFAAGKYIEGNVMHAGGDYEFANIVVHCLDAEINTLLHALNMHSRSLAFAIDQRVLPGYRRTDRNWAWVAAFIGVLGFMIAQFKATNLIKRKAAAKDEAPRRRGSRWAFAQATKRTPRISPGR